jgi:hypothetical protein
MYGKKGVKSKILLFSGMTFFSPEGQNHQKWLTCRFWAKSDETINQSYL